MMIYIYYPRQFGKRYTAHKTVKTVARSDTFTGSVTLESQVLPKASSRAQSTFLSGGVKVHAWGLF